MRGNGERIGPQNLPTSSIAGGIWNLLNQQRAQQRGAWPSATPAVTTDPYFMYVPLLLNTTSTNGQQNNTFLDSSTNNFTITRNGTPTQGAFTPYQPSGYWSGYFGGSADGLKGSITSGVTPISGDFTWEGWVYFNSLASAQCLIGVGNTQNRTILYFDNATGLTYVVARSGANQILISQGSTSGWSINTWYHFAVVRSGNNYTIYRNGTSIASGTSTYVASDLTQPLTVGYSDWSTSYLFTGGYISNVRAVYGTAIVPPAGGPTTPLTAVTGTSLLTLQDNRFKDNAATPNIMTVVGSTKVQAFQPFAPAASYSAATYGGSGYFNGSTDYLDELTATTAFNLSSGDWTIEAWIYRNVASANHLILNLYNSSGANSGLTFYVNSSNQLVSDNGTVAALSGGTVPANQWVHLAIVRSSGTTTGYVNGVSIGTNTQAPATAQYARIGALASSLYYFNGYISNLRIVKGTAIVPSVGGPTIPLTAVSGTSLLTNFTNAGIYDAAWQNNVTTVGDAQASTTITAKWPPTSMKFDGTVDALSIPSSTSFGLGTGDWTIEFWLYLNAVSTQTIVSMLTTGTSTAPHIYYASGGGIRYYTNSADRISGSALSTGVWYYIAVTKSSGNTRMYINGTQTGATYPDANNYGTSNPFAVADYAVPLSGVSTLNGYVQDVRITKGVARTITTPTAAFPTR